MVTSVDTSETIMDKSLTYHLTLKLNNHAFIADSNTCYYDSIGDACRKNNECSIGAIKMGCIIGDIHSSSFNVLSFAGNHQFYATNLLPSIYFCKFTYPVEDVCFGP